LATFEEGAALFGSIHQDSGPDLLAVALTDTELVGEARTDFVAASAGAEKIGLAGEWIHTLSSATEDDSTREDLPLSGSPQEPARALDAFHMRLRTMLADLDHKDLEARRQRLVDKERRRLQTTQEAIAALAGAARPQSDALLPVAGQPMLAAIGAVGRWSGIKIVEPPRAMRDLAGAQYARAVASASRIRVRTVMLTEAWWNSDAGPLVAFRGEDRQPVALLPTGHGRYRLYDPVRSTYEPVNGHVAATLDPRAYMLYRPLASRMVGAWDLIRFGFRGHQRTLRTIVLAALMASLLGMLMPIAFGILVDSVIPDGNRVLLLQLAGALAAAALGTSLFDLVQGCAVVRLESSASHDTQAAVWDRLLGMRPAFFRNFSTGDLVNRGLSVSTIHRQLSGSTFRALIGGAAALLNLFLLFFYSARLALLGVGVAALASTVTVICGLQTIRRMKPLQEVEGAIFGLTVELIQGVSKLRVSAGESAAFARWAGKFVEQQRLKQSVQRFQDVLHAFNEFLPVFASTLLFWLASTEIRGDRHAAGLSTGTFLAFNAAFGTFLGGAMSMSNTLVEALQNLVLFERAQPILQGEPEVDARKADPGTLSGKLEVDHITFRYRTDGPLTLENVTLRAAPGEFIAIVGPSGSGKSTLLRMLLGFETPESGAVYYDGQAVAGLDVHAVRRQIGVVLQSSNIMAGSILENIAAGAPITLNDALAAARDAGLEQDLDAMPMGMHTFISEGGTNLSGGQRQRLLIARALACRPRVVFFDEATSALDNRTQAIVSRSLERLQVTRIVIAHRLSTIQNAQRIYVIDAGRVVQEGSFSELAARQDGLFARMMARQML
jgi:NHLM bacteriocin system ABC transporter ATP-binding protein